MSQVRKLWANTRSMPFILRSACQTGMIVPFVLLLALLPGSEFVLGGRKLSYSEAWSFGLVPAGAVALSALLLGSWGLAARRPVARWLLVSAPALPTLVLAIFGVHPISASEILKVAALCVLFYLYLFHSDAVSRHVSTSAPVDTVRPN